MRFISIIEEIAVAVITIIYNYTRLYLDAIKHASIYVGDVSGWYYCRQTDQIS